MQKPFKKFVVTIGLMLFIPASQAQDRYIFKRGDAAVVDASTGLAWRRCPVGQFIVKKYPSQDICEGDRKEFTRHDAVDFASKQKGWRIPTLVELSTLYEENKKYEWSHINSEVFPRGGAGYGSAWSSTVNEMRRDQFGMFDFDARTLAQGFARERFPENLGLLMLVRQ